MRLIKLLILIFTAPLLLANLGAQGVVDPFAPLITIRATDSSATEGADSGIFTFSRQNSTNQDLRVFFNISGTAQNGTDYKSIDMFVLIPAGSREARLEILPIDDLLIEPDETVILRLTQSPLANPGNVYQIGTPAEATVTIHDNDAARDTNQPPKVEIVSPTNGASFTAPANMFIFASPSDVDGTVETVEFFAGTKSLGIVTNNPFVMNIMNPWNVYWANVPAGSYALWAKATDDKGAVGISPQVHILVRETVPPPTVVTVLATDPDATEIPLVPPGMGMMQRWDPAVFTFSRSGDTGFPVTVYYSLGGTATNGIDYSKLPGSITIPAGALSADVTVDPLDDLLVEGTETVEILIQPVACPAIYPPPPGCYQIGSPSRALAYIHDNDTEPGTNQPPFVKLISPRDGSEFKAPATIFLQAGAGDPDGSVTSVVFYAGSDKIGQTDLPLPLASIGTPLVYGFAWSNVIAGRYLLTAKAFDNQGASALSGPVNISVVTNFPPPPTNRLPVLTITAPDSYAAEGTNREAKTVGGSPNTATFVIHRDGPTNSSLVVFYAVGGSASNGVDYLRLPGTVTIPAGERSARIVITPIDDAIPEPTESVVLGLAPSPMASLPTYDIGFPGKAGAVIVDNDGFQPPTCRLPDGLFHLCIPCTNGWPYRIECSTAMTNWISICTNVVVDGAIHFVEPDTATAPQRFYRILPELNAPVD